VRRRYAGEPWDCCRRAARPHSHDYAATPPEWFERHSRRVKEYRLPPASAEVESPYETEACYGTKCDRRWIDLIGPIYEECHRQAKAKQGFEAAHFQVDWDARQAICPQGKISVRWCETNTARGGTMIVITFSAADCMACSTWAMNVAWRWRYTLGRAAGSNPRA
jgi:hypothetical protein